MSDREDATVQQLLTNAQVSDRDVAEYLTVSHHTVSRWRLGEYMPSPERRR